MIVCSQLCAYWRKSSHGSTWRRNQFWYKQLPAKEEITSLGKCIHEIDPTIQITDTWEEHLKSRKQLQDFMKHCCVQRQYFFCIKKCGVQGCKICKPPRLPSIVCAKLSFFPDPLKKSASDSYQDFSDIWGKNTSKKDRPSLASSKKGKEKVKILFRMSAETVCDILICDVCLKSRSSLQLWGRNHTQKLWTVDIVLPWTSWWVYWWCCCYHCGAFGDLRPITVELKHNYVSNCAPCLQWVLWLWEKGTNQRPMFFCRQNIF